MYCNLGEVGWGIVSQDIALYCNRGGLGAQALGWACRRWAGAQAGAGRRRGRWGVCEARGRAGEHAGARGARGMSGRRAGVLAATRPCWPATRSRGQLRHDHGCCDMAPVRAVCAAMQGLGVAWELGGVLAGSTGPSWCTVHLAQF